MGLAFNFIHCIQCRVCTRELIILEALAEGLSYKMVAKKIFLSVDGVRYHIRNIYSK
ncbi:MAG: DNA-binding response regulator, partial [Rhodothermaeota bacterium MED-G12]